MKVGYWTPKHSLGVRLNPKRFKKGVCERSPRTTSGKTIVILGEKRHHISNPIPSLS